MPNYYPPTGYHFRVIFQDPANPQAALIDTGFQTVTGMSADVGQYSAYQEGGENRFSHRLPNPITYGTLDMKRGLLTGSTLVSWFQAIQEGFQFETKDIIVMMLNDQGIPILGWNFVKAYPIKWSFDELNATNSAIYAESLSFNYQYYTRLPLVNLQEFLNQTTGALRTVSGAASNAINPGTLSGLGL